MAIDNCSFYISWLFRKNQLLKKMKRKKTHFRTTPQKTNSKLSYIRCTKKITYAFRIIATYYDWVIIINFYNSIQKVYIHTFSTILSICLFLHNLSFQFWNLQKKEFKKSEYCEEISPNFEGHECDTHQAFAQVSMGVIELLQFGSIVSILSQYGRKK